MTEPHDQGAAESAATAEVVYVCTARERRALRLLTTSRSITTSMLAFHLDLPPASTVALLKGLVAQGWAERTSETGVTPMHWTRTPAGGEVLRTTTEEGRRIAADG